MNSVLCKPYTAEEIGDALFQIGPLKLLDQMACLADSFNGIGFC
jgi:hypothetical protein